MAIVFSAQTRALATFWNTESVGREKTRSKRLAVFPIEERIGHECAALPDPADHRRWLASITQEIEAHRQRGELSSMRHLIRQRELRVQDYQISRQRVDELIRSVAWHFLDRNQGDEIELYLLERLIPRPMDIESGVQLTAPRFLSEPRLIGSFTISDFRPRRKIP